MAVSTKAPLPSDEGEALASPARPTIDRAPPSRLAADLAVIRVLWRRDLVRFFRQKSRVIGALVQPLLFWFIIGSGFSSSFRVRGAEGVGYMQYFFPGIVLMVILFTSIFSTMSLIEDRHEGFLQAVLASPGSRAALVLGKTLGGSTIAMVQALAMLALAPLAGFSFGSIAWAPLLLLLAGISVALTAIGFVVAWWLDSVQGYHAVMSVLLLPAWIVSGAMFPIANGPSWLRVVTVINPLAYAASGIRRSLSGSSADALSSGGSLPIELAVVLGATVLSLVAATAVCKRKA